MTNRMDVGRNGPFWLALRPLCCLLALAVCVGTGEARAQSNWGVFWGGVADGISRSRQEDLAKQAQELEKKRLQLLEEQLKADAERQRKEKEAAAERARQAEAEAARKREAERRASGSGFFVSTNGHILTNAHVVKDFRYLFARDISGNLYQLDLVAVNPDLDLALLQAAKKTEGLPVMETAAVEKGMRIYVIGYPNPTIQGTESKITDGIISSMTGYDNAPHLYQISAPIQGGNSGGPLVTENGQVVGVVVATANPRYYINHTGSIPQNVNFAIKNEKLTAFLANHDIYPPKQIKPRKNPLGFVDQNTVMILAYADPVNVAAAPSPSGRGEVAPPGAIAAANLGETGAGRAPGGAPEGSAKAPSAPVRCKIGNAPPVETLREKCQLVGGKEI